MGTMFESENKRPRVIVADDDPDVLAQLQILLEAACEVVAAMGDGQSLVNEVERLRPDVVIADITMPGMDGLKATEELARRSPDIPVVILSVHDQEPYVQAARDAGAVAYVVKRRASSDLLPAIRSALFGEPYVSPGLRDGV
jgi:DNA-binding NarL/FixJ family response regulator